MKPSPACPTCGATGRPVLYGSLDEDGVEAAVRGTAVLGGSEILTDSEGRATNPAFRCENGHEWGRVQGFDRK